MARLTVGQRMRGDCLLDRDVEQVARVCFVCCAWLTHGTRWKSRLKAKRVAYRAPSLQHLAMSNRLSRDTEDAAKVLAAFRDKFHPYELLAEKLSAAEDLRAKLVNVTSGVRQWTVKAVGDDTWLSLNGAGTVQVRTDLATGRVQLSTDGKIWQEPALEYDVFNHEWVGSELDTDIVLSHGERRPHKAALVTMSEALVRALTGNA